jgi:hypothetical protein
MPHVPRASNDYDFFKLIGKLEYIENTTLEEWKYKTKSDNGVYLPRISYKQIPC